MQYYGAEDADELTKKFFSGKTEMSYTLTPTIKDGLNRAFLWWAEILAPGAVIKQPAQYFVTTFDDRNANSVALSIRNNKSTRNPDLFNEIFQRGRVVDHFQSISDLQMKDEATATHDVGIGIIRIGKHLGIDENDGQFGWITTDYYALPVAQAMKGIDITSVMFHEIGHSIGILADRNDNPYEISCDGTKLMLFGDAADNPYTFTSHLRDQSGKEAKSGMWILSNKIFEDPDFKKAYSESAGKDLSLDEVFIVDDINSKNGRKGETYAYFVGDNVSEALDGKTFTRIDGVEVSGIPVNLWEDHPDLSHIELERSMMSHQRYRSYSTFMEAELALLQDIGYKIDRKNFYGRSIYLDNQNIVNEQGFSARKDGKYVDGYNNSTMGVGLHVYGSNNDVIQRGNIWSDGTGAAGIRIDGLNNKITVPQGTEIRADGTQGTGILIAYGKNQQITIDGTVTANGDHGDGVHFEFGANSLGGTAEYRGSFMRYIRVLDKDGKVAAARNFDFTEIFHPNDDYSITDYVNGDINEKMGSITVNGKLESKSGAAIYIAEESFVDKIDINAGAEVLGDIQSVWKQFDKDAYGIFDAEQKTTYQEAQEDNDGNITGYKKKSAKIEPLCVQYKGKKYVYNKYIPDHVTQINFNAGDGVIIYNGDIKGSDNIKINVTSGTVYYGGTANVVSVNVAKGAKLIGGNFIVNDMSKRIAKGFKDSTTGKFINNGTVGGVNITGKLVNDGTLLTDEESKALIDKKS